MFLGVLKIMFSFNGKTYVFHGRLEPSGYFGVQCGQKMGLMAVENSNLIYITYNILYL